MDNLSTDNDIIENEEGNDAVGIDVPFDPNQINVSSPPMNVGDIIDRLENGEIMLDTEFQRLPDLWNNVKKSRFIESLLLKLPIPKFYFDGQDDNKWRVIDGLQRVSTFKSFMKENMLLQGLEFLKEYENKTFDGLPRELQRRIKGSALTVHVLEKGTPDVVKFLLFSRINQGSLLLTPQEIRHAMHQGKASDLIKELVDKDNEIGQSFIKVTEGKIPTKRMEDRDFAARFVAFYLLAYDTYQPDLYSFLNAGMATIVQLSPLRVERLKLDFQKAMEAAFAIFGNDAFRKRFNTNDQRKPINKALFEVLSVCFAKRPEAQIEVLIARKNVFIENLRVLHGKTKFLRSISQGTALQENVYQRFGDIQDIIDATLDLPKGFKTLYAIFIDESSINMSDIDELERDMWTANIAKLSEEDQAILIGIKSSFIKKILETGFKFDGKSHLSIWEQKSKTIEIIIKTTLENAKRIIHPSL